MRQLIAVLSLCALVWTSGCGAVESLVGGGGGGSPATPWTDVPIMDGVTRQDSELPLPARLLLRTVLQPTLESAGISAESFEFMIYESSTKKPQDVVNFYTKERMAAAGWTGAETLGCLDPSQTGTQGVYCLFSRTDAQRNTLLALFVTEDQAGKIGLVFFRFSGAAQQNQGN